MLPLLLVMTALAGTALSSGVSKCDVETILKIENYLNGIVPEHLIQTAKANGKEVVVGTTSGYYGDSVASTFSYFVQEKSNALTRVDIYEILKNGTLTSKKIHVKEECGSTYDPNTKVRRYHLYQDAVGGVTGFYACSESDSAKDGAPAGIVKVRAFDYNKESLSKAIVALKIVGVDINKSYTDNP